MYSYEQEAQPSSQEGLRKACSPLPEPHAQRKAMKFKTLCVLLIIFLGAPSTHAATGKSVVDRCNHAYMASVDKSAKVNQQDAAWCYGYINSVIDTANAYQSMINVSSPFCFPKNLDTSVILLAIVGIGPSHQPSLDQNGAEMLINIFRNVYPCKK